MMPVGAIIGGILVSATEAISERTLGLRMPFLIGAAVHLGLSFYARPVLNTANIEAAKAEASTLHGEPSEQ